MGQHETRTGQAVHAAPPLPTQPLSAPRSIMLSTAELDSFHALVNGEVDPNDPSINPIDLMAAGVIIAPHLKKEGTSQVHEHLIKGEDETIHGIFGALVDPTNANMMLDSETGAGKSTLFEGIFRLVEGMDNLAYVPGRPDLTPEEFIGRTKTVATTRQVDGEDVVEYMTGVVYPIVTADTQAMLLDEVNQNNPRTMSAANSILAKRQLETTRGQQEHMKALEIALTGKNPKSSDPSLQRLRHSLVDRFSRGTILGRETEWEATLQAIGSDFEPDPEAIRPVITLAMLHVAQAAVKHVAVEAREEQTTQRAAVAIAKVLRDQRWIIPVRTTPYRLYSHLTSVARTEALMDGRIKVSGQDIGKAVRTKLTASLTGNDMVEDYAQVDDTVHEVVDTLR